MSLPDSHPHISALEDTSDESTLSAQALTSLSASERLAALVSSGDFQAAEALRQEMASRNIPIVNDQVYLGATLNAIIDHQSRRATEERLNYFEVWLSLLPDIHAQCQSFEGIERRIFHSRDDLNLVLAYRFGLVLVSKGYHSSTAATHVVSNLARPSVLQGCLRELEGRSRGYHSRRGDPFVADSLANLYDHAVRTSAAVGEAKAALQLIFRAQSRGIQIPEVTLLHVVTNAPNQQHAIDRIRRVYPSWSMPVRASSDTKASNITILAAELHSLGNALKSPSPPSAPDIHGFMTSYQAISLCQSNTNPRRRTRALSLLHSISHRHSHPNWAFAEMLYHHQREEPLHVLRVFVQNFHLVGIPRTRVLSLTKELLGKQSRQDVSKILVPPCPMWDKLRPSPCHTALVWDSLLSLSSETEQDSLYDILLLRVVGLRRQEEAEAQQSPDRNTVQPLPNLRSPWKASAVLKDMLDLGIQPILVQWGIVARGYTQHGDAVLALHILDRVHEIECKKNDGKSHPSDMLLTMYPDVMVEFVTAGELEHAQEVEQYRYRPGDRKATDTVIGVLREREKEKSSQ
ncbi:hypothetical protein BU15DRAFT_64624 [Melanogaster broomeanus]|nr:hypothetical protein BU15DRAFT_64624 [Melanogaster broomeanus]